MKTLLLFGAGFVAGLMNAIAGGGTIVTFPALLFAGLPAIPANATSTMALLPGTITAVIGYRKNLPATWRWILLFLPASALGGLLGGILLTCTPAQVFDRLVPFLILFATVVFMARGLIVRIFPIKNRQRASRRWLAGALVFQFLVSLYGGYFGAGIGILMLASLGLLGFSDIHEMNVVKGVLGFVINVMAAVYFALRHLVHWPEAGVVALGGITGGFLGAHFAQRVPQRVVRWAITTIGLGLSAALFYQRLG
ncbi:MAG: sulfite exporter TauE/SafE family protein [Verrucomicrobiota bacterium]|nr:sulfite exporter TauE/SafE family protein [Verrucomicrobiota bacterium]